MLPSRRPIRCLVDRFTVRSASKSPLVAGLLLVCLVLISGAFATSGGLATASETAAVAADPGSGSESVSGDSIRLAKFDIDVTPPLGSMMAYDPVVGVSELTLRARGLVLLGKGQPIVLCAVDWIGIANQSHDAFRDCLATAAGTSIDRVTVHSLHQHDAPRSDFTAEALLQEVGATDRGSYDGSFDRQVLGRLSDAVRDCLDTAVPVTAFGHGTAVVQDVASNRRIQDATGSVVATRFTATRDAQLRAQPVGIVDPELSFVGFWSGDQMIAACTYFACHPQSYYRTGIPSVDFPGIARFMLAQDFPGCLFVHFNGAGGNVGAGKYNDGSPPNRLRLAERLADAMRAARSAAAADRRPLTAANLNWVTTPVRLPPGDHLTDETLREPLRQSNWRAAGGRPDQLAYLVRYQAGQSLQLSCLGLDDVAILHLPGELFVEYQLAAKQMRPDLHVAMAAYADYGPGYIGTAESYGQGGYEASPAASKVTAAAEAILMSAIGQLLADVRQD